MLKRNKIEHNFFLSNLAKIVEINEHYDDCIYRDRIGPIDVYTCNCYAEQIFMIGSTAQRDQFYK